MTEQPKKQEALEKSTWSKDYAEHLRTVHFTLIGVCLGIVVLVTNAKSFNPDKALRQADEIVELQREWNSSWIREYSRKTQMQLPFVNATNVTTDIAPELCREAILFSREDSKPIDSVNVSWANSYRWFGPFAEEKPSDWDWRTVPLTVADFAEWWNLLHKGVVFYNVDGTEPSGWVRVETSTIVAPRIVNNYVTWTKFTCGFAQSGNAHRLITVGNATFEPGMHPTLMGIVTSDSREGITALKLPVSKMTRFQFTQQSLQTKFPDWTPGTFESSFGELARAVSSPSRLRISDVSQHLYDLVNKGSSEFEAFGLKFPTAQLTIWGISAVIAVQLYLFVYLRNADFSSRKDSSGWEIAWIGTSQDRLSKFMFACSILLFPTIATGWLCVHAWDAATDHDPLRLWRTPHSIGSALYWQLLIYVSFTALVFRIGLEIWKVRPRRSRFEPVS